MIVFFRVDASLEIGTGHLMRCLILAEELKPVAKIVFLCRSLTPTLGNILLSRGFEIEQLHKSKIPRVNHELKHSNWLSVSQREDAFETLSVLKKFGKGDWLVVDHYALDYRYERAVRRCVNKIMVIDDLADRRHDCDLLVDQNLSPNWKRRYITKVPEGCICLLGPKYCFLRKEFIEQRCKTIVRKGRVRSVLIYYGGVDRFIRTQEAIETLIEIAGNKIAKKEIVVNVVVGSEYPAIEALKTICRINEVRLHIQTKEMAQLMAEADLALGSGGISTYERIYLRLPALLTPVADNQREPLKYMESLGYFKTYETEQELKELLKEVLVSQNNSPKDSVENGIPVMVEIMKNDRIAIPNGI